MAPPDSTRRGSSSFKQAAKKEVDGGKGPKARMMGAPPPQRRRSSSGATYTGGAKEYDTNNRERMVEMVEQRKRIDMLNDEIRLLRQAIDEKDRMLREISSHYDKELAIQAEKHSAELGRFELVVEVARQDALIEAERATRISCERLRMTLSERESRSREQLLEVWRRAIEQECAIKMYREEVASLRSLLAHTATRQREQLESFKEATKLEQKAEMKRFKEGYFRRVTTELREELELTRNRAEEYCKEIERLKAGWRESETDKYRARDELRKAKEMRIAAMNKAGSARRELAIISKLFRCRARGEEIRLEVWSSRKASARGSEASTSCPPTSREVLLESQLKRAKEKLDEMRRTAVIILKSRSKVEEYLHEAIASCKAEQIGAVGSASAAARALKLTARGQREEHDSGGMAAAAGKGVPDKKGNASPVFQLADNLYNKMDETFLTGEVDESEDDSSGPYQVPLQQQQQQNEKLPHPEVPPLPLLDGQSEETGLDDLAAAVKRAQMGEEIDIDVAKLTWESKQHILRLLFRRMNSDPLAAINNRERGRLRAQLASLGATSV
ncbi:hypothetical protein FOL47_000986 [Perkinsus chesapeaki]|uniref:Uncharacterized protein n=1 Tax=Perkinsus chesapeaki TaxID=330153 RepID=A0A7J6MKR9_PERCH|nr:hypothetical protein FOL47_000986 [Perkinsus chesapeaki]